MAVDSGIGSLPRSRTCRDGRVLVCDGCDHSVRWRPGERLEHVFEQRCDALREAEGNPLAVEFEDGEWTYRDLEAAANRLARHLRSEGVSPGDRVALLFERPVDGYAGMLAVLKLHAAYVPLDPGFPPDRCAYIVEDAGAKLVLTRSGLEPNLQEVDASVRRLRLDEVADEISQHSDQRLSDEEVGAPVDDLAYLIYTSGTTGRPKGVAIAHPSICNFVRVAAEVYGYTSEDRVYQGLTNAFDFAVEEIWVPWMVGATLVPKPGSANLLGPELGEFLRQRRITAMCCVPTLLATLEPDLPDLRLLIVSGESCPPDLVERWHRDDRRLLNVYGPTEATVSATWTVLEPERPVTIGVPLPTYSVVILDPDRDEARPLEEEGEIGIAGIALAEGYLNRPEKTESAFIEDFLGLENNPSGRIYRTGDLGRVNDHGELEHLGRIDTQVKLRGYRIELEEIEAVLREAEGIDQAVVTTHQPEEGVDELVAYYTAGTGAPVDVDAMYAMLSEKLPPYEVPAYLEQLDELPLMPSGKVDRKALPEPRSQRRLAAQGEHVEADSDTEQLIAEALAGVLGVDEVSVESHFFDELGVSSLLMARLATELRERSPQLPALSMRQAYAHPTVRSLAAALTGEDPTGGGEPAPAFQDPEQPEPIGTPHYVLCGGLQLLVFLAYACLAAFAFDAASAWLVSARGVGAVYVRALAVGSAFMAGIGTVPILAKWVLIGRWRPQRIRAWSLPYLRFWIVKTLLVANPAARMLRGTILFKLYLRALGARVGRGTTILTRNAPVCTDLISIGASTLIRNDTYLNGYRARDGMIEIGPVSIGADAFVGEACVLDVYSTVEDGATVGHTSSVQAGQVVPAGETWHGSPVRPAGEGWNYRTVDPRPASRRRLVTFNLVVGGLVLLVLAPAYASLICLLVAHPAVIVSLSTGDAILVGLGVVVVGFLTAGLVVGVVPRLLSRLLEPGRVYPLHGFHHAVQRIVQRTSTVSPLNRLFGDSVAIVGYLRWMGWQLGHAEQTGSNFGLDVRQEVPALSRVGRGTMVSDGLSMMNAEFSPSSFRVVPAQIGERCFLGNRLAWPGGARAGDNLLVATKAMIPVGGEARSDTGLLGSPCFEIPRSVEDDEAYRRQRQEPERTRRLRAKTRHNAVTMGLYVLTVFALETLALIIAVAPLGDWFGTVGSELLDVLVLPLVVLGGAEVAAGSRRLKPRNCTVLERDFWKIERFWKLLFHGHMRLFDGTPFKGWVWRLHGVQVGPRLFDDGGSIVERSLTRLGTGVTLNVGAEMQGHSLENGMFKSDRIQIGSGCTLGVGALVHYGTTMEDGSVLEADSFLMKGSRVSAGTRWRGNPAEEVART